MKKLFYYLSILIISFVFAWNSQAQTQLIYDEIDGTYVTIQKTAPKAVDTGLKFKDKSGKTYPIMKGSRGGFYILRMSKNGNLYRQSVQLPNKEVK